MYKGVENGSVTHHWVGGVSRKFFEHFILKLEEIQEDKKIALKLFW